MSWKSTTRGPITSALILGFGNQAASVITNCAAAVPVVIKLPWSRSTIAISFALMGIRLDPRLPHYLDSLDHNRIMTGPAFFRQIYRNYGFPSGS